MGLATLISRILGFIRDMIIANLFGAKAIADAFFVAFRIPNLLRRFTAEGALTAAFIPIFSEKLENLGKQEAFRLACNVLGMLAVTLAVIISIGMLFAPQIVYVIAPGFVDDEKTFQLTSMLTMMMFPYLFFISITALLMAMLNTLGKFFIPALAPASFNVIVISCALGLHGKFEEPTLALATGVLIGGVAQLSIQLWPLFKLGFRYVPVFDLKDQATRRVGILMVPAALGMAVAEINVFIDTLLASLLSEGSVSYLYYGNRVVQFPLGVFGVAVGIAALPSMSSVVARGQQNQLTDLLSHSLRLILFISIPSTIGLIVLAEPISNVLFERGKFDEVARSGTAFAMALYAVGLVGFSGVKVTVSAFYAMKDTKTPTRVAAWCMVLNVALNLILMVPLKHGGLALATSISSMVNMFTLLLIYRHRYGGVDGMNLLRSSLKMLATSAFMLAAVYWYSTGFFSFQLSTLERASHLAMSIIIGVLVYSVIMLAIGSDEAKEIKGRFIK